MNFIIRKRLSIVKSDINNLEINYSINLYLPKIKLIGNKRTDYLKAVNFLIQEDSMFSIDNRSVILRILPELILGELFGVLGGYIGGAIGTGLAPGIDNMLFCGYLGYVLSIPVGVYVADYDQYEKGSFLATLGGSVLGALSWIHLLVFDAGNIEEYLMMLGLPIGAVAGYNLTLKPKSSSSNALINFYQGKVQYSFDNINIYYDYCSEPVLHVNLFQSVF